MKRGFYVTASAVLSVACGALLCSAVVPERAVRVAVTAARRVMKSASADDGYVLRASMQGDSSLVGGDYAAIHRYMRSLGWDYSEHPNSSEHDHHDGVHCQCVYDRQLGQYVFRFISHAGEALDGDRGRMGDRQRNEMKSRTSDEWHGMNGNWDEWQCLEWKFRIPKGYRPSPQFCHIHQLKAQEGNNGAPLITITLRSDADGGNRRVQVIHTGDTRASSLGVLIDNVPIEDFEDEWVQVRTEMHYTHEGEFNISIVRVRDGKELLGGRFGNVDLWRRGATNIRNKFGIYRSLGRRMESAADRPSNGIKDETLLLGDFRVYERNSNPSPVMHD